MKRLLIVTTALTLLAAPMSAFAQPGRDDHRDNHPGNAMMMRGPGPQHNWRKGGRIGSADWNRGTRISDYGRYHLSRPPRGYEWRRVDNNYVLAAVAGGLIASVIMANQ